MLEGFVGEFASGNQCRIWPALTYDREANQTRIAFFTEWRRVATPGDIAELTGYTDELMGKRPEILTETTSDPCAEQGNVEWLRSGQATEAQEDQLMICDFCSSPAPAWRYPADSFTDIAGSRSVEDWLACEACHLLIVGWATATALARRSLCAPGVQMAVGIIGRADDDPVLPRPARTVLESEAGSGVPDVGVRRGGAQWRIA